MENFYHTGNPLSTGYLIGLLNHQLAISGWWEWLRFPWTKSVILPKYDVPPYMSYRTGVFKKKYVAYEKTMMQHTKLKKHIWTI